MAQIVEAPSITTIAGKTSQKSSPYLLPGLLAFPFILKTFYEGEALDGILSLIVFVSCLGLQKAAHALVKFLLPKALILACSFYLVANGLEATATCLAFFPCLLLDNEIDWRRYIGVYFLSSVCLMSTYLFASHSHLPAWIILPSAWGAIGQLFLSYQTSRNQNNADNIAFKNLVRVACHDISNPLTMVSGSAQLAESGILDEKPEKMKTLWPRIQRSSDKINRVLTALRAYEALQEPNKLLVTKENTSQFMEDLKLSYRDMAKAYKVTVLYDLSETMPEYFWGDRLLLKGAVFGCLLSNGIRHSPQGEEVHVSIEEVDKFLVFTVKNIGTLTHDEIIENLYAYDFVDRPTKVAGKKSGGFSLAICALVIKHYGGVLDIKCYKGDSTTKFEATIKLPLNI